HRTSSLGLPLWNSERHAVLGVLDVPPPTGRRIVRLPPRSLAPHSAPRRRYSAAPKRIAAALGNRNASARPRPGCLPGAENSPTRWEAGVQGGNPQAVAGLLHLWLSLATGCRRRLQPVSRGHEFRGNSASVGYGSMASLTALRSTPV